MNTATLIRQRVYDPLLRLIHAWNATAVIALITTGFGAELLEHGPFEAGLWQTHIAAGYALIVGLAARLAWGLVGPRSARLSDLWQLRAWSRAWHDRSWPRRRGFGHDPAASLVFIALYVLLVTMSVSGLALAAIEHGSGPLTGTFLDSASLEALFEEPHEALAFALLGLTGLHLAAVLWHQFVQRLPTAQAMLNGYQYRRREHKEVGHA